MIFLDTSVLVAIAQVSHSHHAASRALWNRCTASQTATSAHALAELYSVLTSMPPGFRLSPANAMAAIEIFLQRLTPIALSAQEYTDTLHEAVRRGCSGGTIYDALHLACARKAKAERICTWNVRHFQRIAPDLAALIAIP